MNISSLHTQTIKTKIINIMSEMTGNSAINLQRDFFKYLDEGKCYLLINLKHVKKIDGLGIRFLEHFAKRGVYIGLFNVGVGLRYMLMISGREQHFKIYEETEPDEVVSVFEKERLEVNTNGPCIKKRHYPRIGTSFQAGLKYQPVNNGVILDKATILNLSENGLLASHITALNSKDVEPVTFSKTNANNLYDIKFRLNGHSYPFEIKGECVRETMTKGRSCVGIRFKDMKHDYKIMTRDFVLNSRNN